MKCKYCGKEITFDRTLAGKSMPVEPGGKYYKPDNDGPVTFIDGLGRVQRGVLLSDEETAAMDSANYKAGRIVHFGRCVRDGSMGAARAEKRLSATEPLKTQNNRNIQQLEMELL